MQSTSLGRILLLTAVAALLNGSGHLSAGEPGARKLFPVRLTGWFKKSSIDPHSYECDDCGQTGGECPKCIERIPKTKCVTGWKRVWKSSVRYEYVSIPEVRYRWKKKKITKEIPADGCDPVCKSHDCEHCYGQEKWTKEGDCCSKLHCRSIEPKYEKTHPKCLECKPGKTTVKVHYWSCVKVPYTVYRRVRRPICLKEPRHEKVKVPITKYKCKRAKCESCDEDEPSCTIPRG